MLQMKGYIYLYNNANASTSFVEIQTLPAIPFEWCFIDFMKVQRPRLSNIWSSQNFWR